MLQNRSDSLEHQQVHPVYVTLLGIYSNSYLVLSKFHVSFGFGIHSAKDLIEHVSAVSTTGITFTGNIFYRMICETSQIITIIEGCNVHWLRGTLFKGESLYALTLCKMMEAVQSYY